MNSGVMRSSLGKGMGDSLKGQRDKGTQSQSGDGTTEPLEAV